MICRLCFLNPAQIVSNLIEKNLILFTDWVVRFVCHILPYTLRLVFTTCFSCNTFPSYFYVYVENWLLIHGMSSGSQIFFCMLKHSFRTDTSTTAVRCVNSLTAISVPQSIYCCRTHWGTGIRSNILNGRLHFSFSSLRMNMTNNSISLCAAHENMMKQKKRFQKCHSIF